MHASVILIAERYPCKFKKF